MPYATETERTERCELCRWWEAINLPIDKAMPPAKRPGLSETHPTRWRLKTMADEVN